MLLMVCIYSIFFFKQKTAYEMRISDWSSDVCSSDLRRGARTAKAPVLCKGRGLARTPLSGMSKAPGITGDKWRPGDRLIDERWTNTFCDQVCSLPVRLADQAEYALLALRSEEHTSELQSLMRISSAVFCLKKKKKHNNNNKQSQLTTKQ